MRPNGGDNIHVIRALFTFDGDNTGVVHVLCTNDGDNNNAVCALMTELTHPWSVTVEPFESCKYTWRTIT